VRFIPVKIFNFSIDDLRQREKEYEDAGTIVPETRGETIVRSCFHLEESQFKNHGSLQVQLSIRPKTYREFSVFQNKKIQFLEEKVRQLNSEQPLAIMVAEDEDEEEKKENYEEIVDSDNNFDEDMPVDEEDNSQI
jgi:hypothetical protein